MMLPDGLSVCASTRSVPRPRLSWPGSSPDRWSGRAGKRVARADFRDRGV